VANAARFPPEPGQGRLPEAAHAVGAKARTSRKQSRIRVCLCSSVTPKILPGKQESTDLNLKVFEVFEVFVVCLY
jgi:hypothetical protein